MEPPKDRDFALGLGPVVVTPEEPGARDARDAFPTFDWAAALESAAARTVLYPGDIVAGPAVRSARRPRSRSGVSIEVDGIGVLEQRVAG